ncbi:unnamed protein product [Ilex paraguariensis]|uniref:B box-type domain-containing protein n=1 Tax=Ilex paraguariensis TaxID=185542 RepID=A0ABC8SQK6_9AQUA
MELQHFSHKDHPLILKEVQEAESERIICYGCEEPIVEDSMYSCSQCDYFLHKRCAELPQEINDPVHPQHLLTLYGCSPYPSSSSYICNACRQDLDLFNYFCSSCKFNLCISCFLEERTIMHTSHEHPMVAISRPASFFCNGCGSEDMDTSYACHTCHFWIHKTCASLPRTINLGDHKHPLVLVKEHLELTNFRHYCNLCRKLIVEDTWAYYCGLCKYFVHLKCATSYLDSESVRGSEDENEVDELLDSNVIHLPLMKLMHIKPTSTPRFKVKARGIIAMHVALLSLGLDSDVVNASSIYAPVVLYSHILSITDGTNILSS